MSLVTIGKAELHNADCMEYMAGLPDNVFELCIVDPPYRDEADNAPTQSMRAIGGKMIGFGKKPDAAYFTELMRVSKNQIVWGANNYELPPTRGIICWDKVQPWPNFSAWEMAWTSFDCVARMFKFDNRTGDKIHPTQKPIKLYEWLLTNYAKPGDRILDTHLGSMSSVIACLNLGFEVVGCELDSDYFKVGVERVAQSQKQVRMFA